MLINFKFGRFEFDGILGQLWRLAIRTDNFRLSYKLIEKLRAKSLNFEILDINLPVPDDSIVWFSAPSEIIDFPSIGTPIPVEIETIDDAILSALHQIKGNNASISLIIGIDPGPYPGIAWIVDGAFQWDHSTNID